MIAYRSVNDPSDIMVRLAIIGDEQKGTAIANQRRILLISFWIVV
jgi:hypothetical protein